MQEISLCLSSKLSYKAECVCVCLCLKLLRSTVSSSNELLDVMHQRLMILDGITSWKNHHVDILSLGQIAVSLFQ
jgi:hypothetical protein